MCVSFENETILDSITVFIHVWYSYFETTMKFSLEGLRKREKEKCLVKLVNYKGHFVIAREGTWMSSQTIDLLFGESLASTKALVGKGKIEPLKQADRDIISWRKLRNILY